MNSPAAALPLEPTAPPVPPPAWRRYGWLVAAAVALLAGMLALRGAGDRIEFAHGVELLSSTIPYESAPGLDFGVALRFSAHEPLPDDYAVFVHAESTSGDLAACRMQTESMPGTPTSRWGHGTVVEHHAIFHVQPDCAAGDLELRAGLYDRTSGERLPLRLPVRTDQRAFVGVVRVVQSAPAAGQQTVLVPALLRAERLSYLSPWLGWLSAGGLSCLLVLALRGSRLAPAGDRDSLVPARGSRWLQRYGIVFPAVLFLLGVLMALEFVKDDAYISFRYARNLIRGQGFVFNAGERLEGITNFLWALLLAPFEALGLDLFQVCELLGSALGIGCLLLTARLCSRLQAPRRDLSELWAPLWLASSSSFVLYAKSGLEQPLAAFLPLAGAFVLYRARDQGTLGNSPHARERGYLLAGLLLGAGCMTRPELHLLAILLGLPLAVDALRRRAITRAEVLFAVGILAITIPAHLFRYLYYGSLVPNTFYVKTSADATVWLTGLRTLHNMFSFNGTGLLVVLAPLAFIDRRRTLEKSVFALIAVSFMVYYVRVGMDEMHWHRLYIPALPFLCVLAALGMQNLTAAASRALRAARWADFVMPALGWAGFVVAAALNVQTTYEAHNGFDGHGDLAGTYHPDLGKFLVRHERPGGLVAFQDMGSTPYYAPDLNFLDFFGLVDKTVAHARHDHGLHTFLTSSDAKAQRSYDAEMRDYFFARYPEWTVLTLYIPRGKEQQARAQLDADPSGALLGDFYRTNGVQFQLWDDPRFRARYAAVRTWPRSAGYYLALWRRRDLWSQQPREVVLDAPPEDLSGVAARFEGGLELLGSKLTPRALERHEAFVTTWWRLPGPMDPDLTFFVHINAPGLQVPADHIPGDWMYPADRWHPGEILEDRILFQLPPLIMTPGSYSISIGVYRRSTGERLHVVRGPNDGSQRVKLGQLEVDPLYPIVHQLIPPTDVSSMRAHLERIVDSARQPGS